MPGRKKTPLAKLFKDTLNNSRKTLRVTCIFCGIEIVRNGTRMKKHLEKCTKCTEQIKILYLNDNNNTAASTPPREKTPSVKVEWTSLFSQKNEFNSCMDNTSDSQLDPAQVQLARAIYASGCPIDMVENKFWINAFKMIQPSFKVPSLGALSTSLLEKVYNDTATTAKEMVASASSVAVLCNSNIRDDVIVNFWLAVPRPIFFSSIGTGAESHSSQYMPKCIQKVIEEVGPMKVLGICTDNATNMKEALDTIKEKFPHIQSYGCLAHTLHLIFNDVNNIKFAEAAHRDCMTVVKAIKRSQQSMKIPVQTKLSSIMNCMESLQENKHSLQALAGNIESKEILDESVKKLILSEIFWREIEVFLKLLKPIADAITAVEGEAISLSIVMKIFTELESSFETVLSSSPILRSEKDLFKIIPEKKTFHTKTIHFAANLLDPRYRGCHISGEEAMNAMELIHQLAETIPEVNASIVLGQLADYRSKEKLFSKAFVWRAASMMSPRSWWSGIYRRTELSKVAERILSLPPTSVGVKSSVSRHSLIQSERARSLIADRSDKLVFIVRNINLIDPELDVDTWNTTDQAQLQPHLQQPAGRGPCLSSPHDSTDYDSESGNDITDTSVLDYLNLSLHAA